jgi:V/A-type H+/Na+-transporting ATPase subunit D
MSQEVLEGVPPTRMELLKLKTKLSRAQKGHRLLTEKRDSLIMEFMSLSRKAYETVDMVQAQVVKSQKALARSLIVSGYGEVFSFSQAQTEELNAEVEERNVMGIMLPHIKLEEMEKTPDKMNVGLLTTPPTVFEAARQYEKTTVMLLKLAETEYCLRALSDETKKTRRRVNALEYKLIPRIKNTQKKIRMRLEELEREGFAARKMIKRKTEAMS